MLEERPGVVALRAEGPGVTHLFSREPGGHRWQRIPPGERRGRVHTSTVTVAVLTEAQETALRLVEGELEWRTTRGSGPGGQHRNKTESAVVLTHLPTGTTVRCESERSQHRNRDLALRVLRTRLLEAARTGAAAHANAARRAQVGSGQRGDKVRTVRQQDGFVTHHEPRTQLALERYLRGDWGTFPF